MAPTKTIPCIFFPQGRCRNGDSCGFIHERTTSTQNHTSTFPAIGRLGTTSTAATRVASTAQATPDSRASVPCKFVSSAGGCRNDPCPYLHPSNGQEAEKAGNQDFEMIENEVAHHTSPMCLRKLLLTLLIGPRTRRRFYSRSFGCPSLLWRNRSHP